MLPDVTLGQVQNVFGPRLCPFPPALQIAPVSPRSLVAEAEQEVFTESHELLARLDSLGHEIAQILGVPRACHSGSLAKSGAITLMLARL